MKTQSHYQKQDTDGGRYTASSTLLIVNGAHLIWWCLMTTTNEVVPTRDRQGNYVDYEVARAHYIIETSEITNCWDIFSNCDFCACPDNYHAMKG